MLPHYVALVSETKKLSLADLTPVAGALQKQVTRDFCPVWDINAVVSAFPSLDDVPIGYWPIVVVEKTPGGAAGVHLDQDHQPFALVQLSNRWPLTASHECLEMLADPSGNKLVAGDSIKPGQGRVEYLVEICDPSEADRFAYTVNGLHVADFYSPRYFDPVASSGVRYSFTGAITRPRQVLPGGYLSWHDPTDDHWYQAQFFTQKLKIVDLGALAAGAKSLRAEMDRRTFRPEAVNDLPHKSPVLAAANKAAALAAPAKKCKAEVWRKQIAELAPRQEKGN